MNQISISLKKSLLPKRLFAALANMKQNVDIVTAKSDKGTSIIVMNTGYCWLTFNIGCQFKVFLYKAFGIGHEMQ